MNNPTQPAIKITLDGTVYSLVFDFEAIAEAEDLTGRPLLTGLTTQMLNTPSISMVRAMLFACMHSESPLTFEQVKPLVNRKNIFEIWSAVLQAWTAGLAEQEPEQVVEANPNQDQNKS